MNPWLPPCHRWLAHALAAATLVALTSCASTPASYGMVQDTLYFGLSRPHGVVTQVEWEKFMNTEVTPRFPQGLTTWVAQGQWQDPRDPHGTVEREASEVVQIVHPVGADADAKIEAIRDTYKKQFEQQSVLRVMGAAKVGF